MPTQAGILALQGDFAAHAAALARLGCDTVLVRDPAQLGGLDLLAMPGGESTTMSLLLDAAELRAPLSAAIAGGLPVLATCAGVILLARRIAGYSGQLKVTQLGLLDVTASRNAYGRQVESFEAELEVDWPRLGAQAPPGGFHGVFIRAPLITELGAQVEVVARRGDEPVMVRQGNIWAAAFHPELAGDDRLHAALVALAEDRRARRS